MKMLHN